MTVYYVDMHLINSTLYKHGIRLIKDVHLIGHVCLLYSQIYILVGIKCGGLFAQKGGELKLAGIHLAVTGYTGLSYSRIRTQKHT